MLLALMLLLRGKMEYIFSKSETFKNLEYVVDPNTQLFLEMDGANGSTTITNSGVSSHTVTANGNAQLKTAVKKFGTASCYFDGTGDYLTVPDSDDWNLGSDRFTVDLWVRFEAITQDQCFFGQRSGGDSFQLEFDFNNDLLRWWVIVGGSDFIKWEESWNPSTNTWYHIAIIRGWGGDVNTWSMCVDGVSLATLSDSLAVADSTGVLNIARSGVGTGPLEGYIDNFRWSKGIARWAANFTPPGTN